MGVSLDTDSWLARLLLKLGPGEKFIEGENRAEVSTRTSAKWTLG